MVRGLVLDGFSFVMNDRRSGCWRVRLMATELLDFSRLMVSVCGVSGYWFVFLLFGTGAP